MNSKEAIHKIRYWLTFYIEGIHEEAIIEAVKQVEASLKRGEKYEEIFEELKQYCLVLERQSVLKEIIRLEQKYFPKPKEKTIEERCDNIERQAKEIMEMFRETMEMLRFYN